MLVNKKIGDGQNTDPQSMDYPNELRKWTSTLTRTTPKSNTPNEYHLKLQYAAPCFSLFWNH